MKRGVTPRDVTMRGEIARGDVARISGLAERTARLLIGQLLDAGLVRSPSPKGPLRLALPSKVVRWYFPRLYPEGVEASWVDGAGD